MKKWNEKQLETVGASTHIMLNKVKHNDIEND